MRREKSAGNVRRCRRCPARKGQASVAGGAANNSVQGVQDVEEEFQQRGSRGRCSAQCLSTMQAPRAAVRSTSCVVKQRVLGCRRASHSLLLDCLLRTRRPGRSRVYGFSTARDLGCLTPLSVQRVPLLARPLHLRLPKRSLPAHSIFETATPPWPATQCESSTSTLRCSRSHSLLSPPPAPALGLPIPLFGSPPP
jgi:hypothetical protein